MTPKPLEEEVAELEKEARLWLSVFVDGRYAPQHERQASLYRSYSRLIADWRKRGGRVRELEACEGRRILDRVRLRLRARCYHATDGSCDKDAHSAVNHIIDPILARLDKGKVTT